MTISSLLAGAGAFASRKPIPKTVKLPTADGDIECEVFFLDLPAADVRELLNGEGRERDERFISAVLCNPDGSLALELEGDHGAKALKLRTLRVLVQGALEALGLTEPVRAEVKKD